jgi:hypothetical protein
MKLSETNIPKLRNVINESIDISNSSVSINTDIDRNKLEIILITNSNNTPNYTTTFNILFLSTHITIDNLVSSIPTEIDKFYVYGQIYKLIELLNNSPRLYI